MIVCPACDQTLAVGAKSCRCGWTMPAEEKRYRPPPRAAETPEWIAARDRCLETMKRFKAVKVGNRDWAYLIMAKYKSGEFVTHHQYTLAAEAIRTDPYRKQNTEAAE